MGVAIHTPNCSVSKGYSSGWGVGGGASCSGPGASVSAKSKYVGGEAKVSVGEVEAHAKANKKGISIGGEATLHKYSSSIDIKIPFTKKSISISGSIGVGSIGAKYDISKTKVKAYTALGVGFGWGIELKG
ncbi:MULTISPECIES: hypothetical protein [Anoxybacillus]|uniref:Uncharacterized protein n=2 Tax=Anoxybacillus TaxID=150247 RepID=A0A1I0TS10_9BACL|nr:MULTISPECIES: hypothetical protein [Anoxybacillus]CUA81215.1 hypothetical protein Ga0061060_12511 [Anoxybacillus suryakundensis]SFA54363.1 hypothetical protein SAMN05216169_10417 [Anoxybacillus pushchinoensis]